MLFRWSEVIFFRWRLSARHLVDGGYLADDRYPQHIRQMADIRQLHGIWLFFAFLMHRQVSNSISFFLFTSRWSSFHFWALPSIPHIFPSLPRILPSLLMQQASASLDLQTSIFSGKKSVFFRKKRNLLSFKGICHFLGIFILWTKKGRWLWIS